MSWNNKEEIETKCMVQQWRQWRRIKRVKYGPFNCSSAREHIRLISGREVSMCDP